MLMLINSTIEPLYMQGPNPHYSTEKSIAWSCIGATGFITVVIRRKREN
jgi:hypothetical protein